MPDHRRVSAAPARHGRGHARPHSGQVVVVPDGAPDACTVPGWPGQIVNTTGMLDTLYPAERQVLLAHFVAAANPLLRP
jgi:hypothetical protein